MPFFSGGRSAAPFTRPAQGRTISGCAVESERGRNLESVSDIGEPFDGLLQKVRQLLVLCKEPSSYLACTLV